MFYDDFCKTDNQKSVFKAISELSKGNKYVAIQELDFLGISRNETEEILIYFEKNGLFREVQHLGENYPVILLV